VEIPDPSVPPPQSVGRRSRSPRAAGFRVIRRRIHPGTDPRPDHRIQDRRMPEPPGRPWGTEWRRRSRKVRIDPANRSWHAPPPVRAAPVTVKDIGGNGGFPDGHSFRDG